MPCQPGTSGPIPERDGSPHTRSTLHVTLASVFGSVIEWYDFFLYATMAALVFNTEFFPSSSPLVGTLVAFGTFAAGFVTRPIGGLLFGHFGDRLGRKRMLVVTMLITGGSTFVMGLLPTYATIGAAAPIVLLALRMLQGIGLGGEWGGAGLLTYEHAPAGRAGWLSSWPQTGVPIGLLLSTLAVRGAGAFGDQVLIDWAWRLPFLASIVLVGVGLFVRLRVSEPPAFSSVLADQKQAKLPMAEVVRHYPRVTLIGMGARFSESITFNVFNAFVLTYTTEVLGMPREIPLNGLLVAAAIGFVVIPLSGWLSDRIGRGAVFAIGVVISGASAFPAFAMIDSLDPALVWLGILLGWSLGACTMFGPEAALFAELFPTRVRYTGISIVYQLGVLPSGAIAPALCTALVVHFGGQSWPVATYVAVFAALAIVALVLRRRLPDGGVADTSTPPHVSAHTAGSTTDRASRQ